MKRARPALLFVIAFAVLAAGATVLIAAPQGDRPNIWSPKYDVRLEVLPDGSLDVTETVTLNVGAKPMTWFDRQVPRRRTDGLTDVIARMDGQDVPVSIDYDRDDDLKVRWDFSPTANATHTFLIKYRAVHVLAREIDGPRLVWTALPQRHTYPIDAAEISVFAPAGSVATAVGATGGEVQPVTTERPGVVIAAKSLRRDRTVSVDITFAPNSIAPVEPAWFVDARRQKEMLPAWLVAALCLVAIGAGILIMMFVRLQRAAAPGADGGFISPAPDGSVPPALVTLLLSRGQQNTGLSMQSAFFRLVRDGHLVVAKRGERSRWRGAAFDVSIAAGAPDAGHLAPHEAWVVDAIRNEGATRDMRRLMLRLSRRQRAFRTSLMTEAVARGWIDAERQCARSGLLVAGLVLMLSGLVGALSLLLFAGRLGAAPIAIPGAILIVGIVFLIVSSAMSVLSEAGLREAARWQARLAELKEIIKGGVSGRSTQDFERWFPLAIGAGLGSRWLKAFEAQLTAAGASIGWLKALGSPADAAASLAMMVAVTGSSHSGGGGAGGGSSGAG